MVHLLYAAQSQLAQTAFPLSHSQLFWELANTAAAAVLLTVSVAAVTLFLFRGKARESTLLYFALFCSLYAVRLLANCYLVRWALPQPAGFWAYANWVITCTIVVPFSLFLHEVVPQSMKKFIRWMIYAQSAFAIFGIVAAAAGLSLSRLNLANNFVVLATIATGALAFFAGSRTSSARLGREVRIFLGGFLIWGIVVVHANLRGMGIVPGQNVEFVGFVVFVSCLAYISLNRIFANERRLFSIENELEIARGIQSSILPRSVPGYPGLDIAARYAPMSAVAGDFYDFLVVDESRLGLLVADVTGHGVPAALIASMLKVAFAAQMAHADDPARVLSGLNQALCGKFEEHFVTAAYLFVDLKNRVLRYAAAGHPPLLLASKKTASVIELQDSGLMLGLFPDAAYSFAEHAFAAGTRCLLYTDGLTEAASPSQEEFGKERCKQFLQTHGNLPAAEAAARLLQAIAEFSGHASGHAQSDDITILVLDFK